MSCGECVHWLMLVPLIKNDRPLSAKEKPRPVAAAAFHSKIRPLYFPTFRSSAANGFWPKLLFSAAFVGTRSRCGFCDGSFAGILSFAGAGALAGAAVVPSPGCLARLLR